MEVTTLDSRRPPRTAWVLGGGGNLGSIQVGMLRALVARGERPDVVLGCSVGALNGLVAAADPTPEGIERLRQVWIGLDADDVFPSGRVSGPWQLFTRGTSMYPSDGLRSLIERCAPHPHLEDYPVPLQCIATNLRTGRSHWFDRGPVREAVLASAALPAVLPPVEIDGEHYIDGGVIDNVPISRALALGCERIVVCHVGNFERPRPVPRRPVDVLLQSFSIARNARFDEDIHHLPDDVEVVVLPGIDPGPIKRTDFSRSSALIERATAAAAAHLDLRAAAAST
jgi:NTE family protein